MALVVCDREGYNTDLCKIQTLNIEIIKEKVECPKRI
jgi:hypothetical protein